MNLSRIIDYREAMLPDMSESKIVAQIRIRTHGYFGGEHKEKSVKFIELKYPVRVTAKYVDVSEVPFIHATRKSKTDFNYLSTFGEGLFLCRDITHLEQVLSDLEGDYDVVLDEIQATIEEMYELNNEKFIVSEVQ